MTAGIPHWPVLLFVEPESYRQMREVMQEYALREDSKEKGATEHRFTEIKGDPSKGSATGYIAKYISKNIDGTDLDKGVYEKILKMRLPELMRSGLLGHTLISTTGRVFVETSKRKTRFTVTCSRDFRSEGQRGMKAV